MNAPRTRTHTHTHTHSHTHYTLYNTIQWSGFGWDTSYITLTMYSVVNKKVSGWELAPCNNKMHELSRAGPSVSILLNAERRKHMWAEVIDSTVRVCVCVSVCVCVCVCVCACVCVCVHSVLWGTAGETPHNNRFTCSIIIDCTFFQFALCLTLINVIYHNNILLLKLITRWDFVFFILKHRLYSTNSVFVPIPTRRRHDASSVCFCLQCRV